MKRSLKLITKRLFALVICLQLTLVTPSGAQAHWLESYDGEEFNTDINSFISFYKSKYPTENLNEKEIRNLLATKGYETIAKSWDTEAQNSNNPSNNDVLANVQLRARAVESEVRRKAETIIDKMYRNHILSRQPNPDEFNRMMFDLYSRYVMQPGEAPALDAFFRVLAASKFNNEQRAVVDAKRSFWGNMNDNFVLSFGAVMLGAIAAKKWPSSWKLTNSLKSRFPAKWSKMIAAKKPTITGVIVKRAKNVGAAGKKQLDKVNTWVYEKLPSWLKPAPKPTPKLLPSPLRSAEFNGQLEVQKTLMSTFVQREGRQMGPIELMLFNREITTFNATVKKVFKINDADVARVFYAKVNAFAYQKGRLPQTAGGELANIYRKSAAEAGEAKLASAVKPVAGAAASKSGKSVTAKVPRVASALKEAVLRHSQKLAEAKKEVTFRSVMKFMGATAKRGVKTTGAALTADLALSTITLNLYKLPNGVHSRVPQDDIDRGINALAILNITCSSETLNNKAAALAERSRDASLSGDKNAIAKVENEFVTLVKETKALAGSYSLMLKIAMQYSNDDQTVMTLSRANIKHDVKTGRIGYYKEHEGKSYPAEFICPTRAGKKFEYVSLQDARLALEKTLDKLTMLDVLKSVNKTSAQALKVKNATRLMGLNSADYNTALEILAQREAAGDQNASPLLDQMDALLKDETVQIANREKRMSSRQFRL